MNDRHTRLARLVEFALLVAAVSYACSGNGGDAPTQSTPESPSSPREPQQPAVDLSAIRVLAGAGQTDTILAILPQALTVEVQDSTGALAAGRSVLFSAVYDVSVSPLGQQSFSDAAVDTTDAQGRAQCLVKLGGIAQSVLVALAVPDLGLVDTVAFTIERGAPSKFVLAPRDTGVLPGGSYTLRVLDITDQGGNSIPGLVPTFTSADVTVTSSGDVTVPNTSPLRANIVVSYQQASDTAKVSVYPRIPMVVARQDMASGNIGPGSTVVLVNSDGTGATDLVRTTDVSIAPSSVAATPSVVYYRGDPGVNSKVWVAEPDGTQHVLLPGETRPEAWPRLSPDGSWVYFARDMSSLWRVKLDGTGLDSLASFASPWLFDAATISPDGSSVAIEDGNGLAIVDVATKARRTLPVACPYPSYSPDGAFFACTTLHELSIVRTDGTGRRILATFSE